ncbi:protein trichome birefringence-like 25 isoform X1 [Abrus precatorius]|uniref:Protein trichome birefringence-like 25 isoform X1 n=1 Tax=Abrus precatorius TaxID=3816 RepID=A0A8B8JV41_ABRPR|nr:protein trichome birefringence-like 25 isoform X1 [Abrus precatorius]XP_027335296.1 protein trichome birefringence-like 25 isoform X1 [Abrus precatorius]XP_027335297.1 protein trichome birefringence-like 25 isoform X1 [Abrus precatorius]XP_027335298.1 protein trichome birefringence-like 25 isoform X1 [Abrus precatorius]
MVKRIRSDMGPFSMQKHNHFCVKFAVSFFLVGLVIRLLLWDSFSLFSSIVVETPPPLAEAKADSPVLSSPLQVSDSDDFPGNNQTQISKDVAEKCDLFVGDWVPDLTGPEYTNESCHVIEPHQNCIKNGRPDSGYLYWRWSPRDCKLPKFNPKKFLKLMRNKSMSFIGDSISRNQVQSLLCILSKVEPAVEVYHDKEYRSKIWKFRSHNFTLSVIWTPFLVKAAIFEDMNGVTSSEIQLYLDKLDNKWTNQYKNFDYVIIGGGKWFLKTAIYHENSTVTGCHYCPGRNLTELGFDYAYRKVLQEVFNFFAKSNHKATVLFRTTTPDHFENGEWFSGGYCNRTVPFKEGQIHMIDVDSIMRGIELEEFEKAISLGSDKRVKLKLLDTTLLSLLRPDGHPGPYRQFHPFAKDKNAKVQNDCLHWCLPGPIDSWNDIIMEMLVNA